LVLLRERRVERILRNHFVREGFMVEPRTIPTGVDIKMKSSHRRWFVEVEGNARKDGKPLKSKSARYTHFYRCVGQICMRMQEGDERSGYAIGLPEDEVYRRYVKTVENALRLLRVKVFWANANGTVSTR